jgi:hypothetical protein
MTKKGDPQNDPFPAVIPNVVRNLQLRIRRETVQNSMRFLVAIAPRNDKKGVTIGMTKKG